VHLIFWQAIRRRSGKDEQIEAPGPVGALRQCKARRRRSGEFLRAKLIWAAVIFVLSVRCCGKKKLGTCEARPFGFGVGRSWTWGRAQVELLATVFSVLPIPPVFRFFGFSVYTFNSLAQPKGRLRPVEKKRRCFCVDVKRTLKVPRCLRWVGANFPRPKPRCGLVFFFLNPP
jgi:hypothetical protein